MIQYTAALERLLAQIDTLPTETRAPGDAAGRVLASAVTSPIALPSFDHAAMDGYALAASTPLVAGSEHAVYGSQAAGDAAGHAAQRAGGPGACEIMTGALLPDGLNAVVAVERTECLVTGSDGMPARIRLLDALHAGDNVRYAGSDVARGAHVLAAGTRIESAQIMLLAALGIATVPVMARPRVAIVCTGKELHADPSRPLDAGRIHNSNGPYLTAALAAAGARVLACETVDDTAATYADALRRAIDAGADLVISTGAVSMGRYDFVPDTLRGFHAQLLFHKVAIRPGKPLLAARLANGPLVIALPGTPMAVAAGLRFMVIPVLRQMTGQGREPAMHAVLDTPQQPKAGLRHFLRASLYQHADGQMHVRISEQQQPFRIRPFADADAWVVLPEDVGDCPAGTRVQVVGVEPGGYLHFNAPY
jgi:molybdopterin molybdotransferase